MCVLSYGLTFQVYLFEVDVDGMISPRPRQVQPIYAIKIKVTEPELCDTLLAASAPGQTAGGALPSPVAVPFLDQHSEQTLAVNQTGVLSPPLLSCQHSMLSPLVSNSNSGLRDQQRPVVMHAGVQNQQHPVVICSGMQNQQHPVAIPPGVQNRQHPVAIPSDLQNQQLPFTIHPGLQNRQDPVRIHPGLQNQQHLVAVPPGLQNQQHPVAVPPGLQNQQHPVIIPPGLQNQQHPIAVPPGLQNQQHPVAVPPGLQNQQHPVVIPPGLQNQQHPIAVPSGLQNQQHPVAVPPGLQNQQHPVVIPPGLHNQQHPVAVPSGLQNQQRVVRILPRLQIQQHPVAMQSVWNQAPVQGQQAVQNPAVNQAGVQNMHVMPTARSLLQNLGYNSTISQCPERAGWNSDVPLGELSLQALVDATSVPERQPPAPVVKTQVQYGRQQTVQDYWYAHSVSPVVQQDKQKRHSCRGKSPGDNRETVPSGSRLSAPALELSPGMGGIQTNPTAIGPSERSTLCEPSVVPPDAASPLGLGMRLPTVITPTETYTEPVVSGPVQPIVIQPTSDVRPFFLMEPPVAGIEPVSASVGGAEDSQMQNTVPWNLFSGGDHEREAVGARGRDDMVTDDCMADNSTLWSLFSVDECAQRAARTPGVSVGHQVEPPVVSGVPTVVRNPMLSSLLIGSQNAETSIAVSVDTLPEQCALTAMSMQRTVSTAVPIQNRETSTVAAVPAQNRETAAVTAVPTQNRETSTVTAVPTQNRETSTVTAVPTQNRETSTVTAVPTQNRETSTVTAVPTQNRETSTVTAVPTQNRETSTVTAVPTQNRETAAVTAVPTQNRETSTVTAVPTQNRETAAVTAVPTQNRETSTVTAVPTQNRETATTAPASIQEMQTATAVSMENRETTTAMPAQNREASAVVTVQNTETAMSVVDTDIADTETTRIHYVGNATGTVSTLLPDSDTHADVTRCPHDLLSDELDDILPTVFTGPDDILGSVHCNFDSGKEVIPAPGANEGDASPADSGIGEKSKELSRIYVHEDGTVELIIERQMNSSSDEDTGGDYLPCSDTASWQRFLSDERFQPKVLLHKLDSVPSSSNRALWCTSEIQKGTSVCGGVDACCSHSDAGKASASEFSDEHLSAATCNIERMDQACSAIRPCPNDAARMSQTYSTAAKDNKSLCPSNGSHGSGVNLPMRVPCRPVMKASLKSNKPSAVCVHLCSPTKCRPCDRSRKHKVKAYSESDKASKRRCKESSGVTLTKHVADAHKRSDSGKHDTKKHHKRRHKKHKRIAEDSSHKRPRKSDTTVKTTGQTDSSDALSEAESLPTISAVVRRSQQRPFNPKSEAQKLSPVAKPWRPRQWAPPGKMPPMLKTVAAKLKHGFSHNMLATWQKSGKITKTITDPTSAELGRMSFNKSLKIALVQKGDGVRPAMKASDHSIRRKPGEIRHLKARRKTVGEQLKTHTASSATFVDSARRHSLGDNIKKKTVCDKSQWRTVGLKQCKDIAARSWLQRSVSEPHDARTSTTCEDTGRNVWSLMGRTMGSVNTDADPAARGYTTNCAGLAQSPVLSADSADSDHSAFTPVALPNAAVSVWSHKPKDQRTAHKTPSHESLASVLTEAWHRSTSQHAVGSSNVLQSKLPKLASKESLKQPLLGRDSRSRRDSGQRDPALAGQDPRSRRDDGQRDPSLAGHDIWSRRDSGQRDSALAGQDTRSRHCSGQKDSLLTGQVTRSRHGSGQRNLSLAAKDTRSRHGSGQGDSQLDTGLKPQCGVSAVDKAERGTSTAWVVTELTLHTKAAQATYAHLGHKSSGGGQIDPRLCPPDDRGRVRPIADVLAVTPVIPLEPLLCEPDVSGGTDWGKLIPVNLPQDAWNTSDFCVACERMSSITREYLSKPPEERHRVMLVYSAKLKKTIQQINDDEMFADGTSASISSTSSRSHSRNSHSLMGQKKQLERQELYKVLSDIKASVAADKVKIASMPVPNKEIHRRIDRCRLNCEIINERLGQLNRFHMDQQIQVLPEILRLCSESDKYISVEHQFLFMRVRPIQLGHCNELYALKEIIEAVYEELSLMSERGVSDSRKDWLVLALGWLHTHRRKMLTEICHLEAQHVCELAELFQQRRAWYR